MADSVAEVYRRDRYGFSDLVTDEGGVNPYCKKTGFGEGTVRAYALASRELQAAGATTSVSASLLEENKQLRKANTRLRNNWDQIKAALHSFTGTREYVPPVAKLRDPGHHHDPELAIALIGDTQIGQLVLPADTGMGEHYNIDVFKERADIYKERFRSCMSAILAPIDTCYVVLGGDIVEGEGIYPLQHSQLDALAWHQIFEGAAVIGDIIQDIAPQFARVVVYCVPGNHGRNRDSTLNSDNMVYAFLKKDLAPQDNIDVVLSASHYMALYLGPELDMLDYAEKGGREWYYLLTHGGNVKSYMSIPAYGLERAVRRYSAATDINFYKMLAFHFHQEASGSRWMINPSWVAGNKYSMEKMQGANCPSQLLLTHHARLGLTSTRHIYLADQPRLEKTEMDEHGVLTPTL
jgi:hypothetical protein